ncbi:MAG TPA: diacylglycerol kinase family protein, partial [Polyangiaceae bacterium]|nr:diacylglycerol kinase family protein [Polyangiaceae bacterium]
MRTVVLVNARAKKGGSRAASVIARALPRAEVVTTQTTADLERFADAVVRDEPDLVLAAGGDGTAIGLLNTVRAARRRANAALPANRRLLRMGILGLGTGNGWANVVHTPRLGLALERLRRFEDRGLPRAELPVRRFDLVEVEGLLAHFAGTGWDAELIDDFHSQKTEAGVLPARARAGLAGYLNGLLTKSVPRNIRMPRVEIEIENKGKTPLALDPSGRPYELSRPASLLYRGPVGICGVGTSSQWGFRFRAFPFAGLVPGRFNLRMYVGTATEALARTPLLWSGKHPLDKMLTWLLTACEVRLSRMMPFQAGGDLLGHRDRVSYSIADE